MLQNFTSKPSTQRRMGINSTYNYWNCQGNVLKKAHDSMERLEQQLREMQHIDSAISYTISFWEGFKKWNALKFTRY
jgi:hypothetical protein